MIDAMSAKVAGSDNILQSATSMIAPVVKSDTAGWEARGDVAVFDPAAASPESLAAYNAGITAAAVIVRGQAEFHDRLAVEMAGFPETAQFHKQCCASYNYWAARIQELRA